MTAPEAINQLLPSYEGYYDIVRENVLPPFAAEAKLFHIRNSISSFILQNFLTLILRNTFILPQNRIFLLPGLRNFLKQHGKTE